MWIVRLALRRPYTFVVMALAILLLGVISIVRMPADVFPDIDIPIVTAIWTYTGVSPDEMAEVITIRCERGFTTGVNDVEHIESQSLAGLAVIKLFFQPGAKVEAAVAQVTAQSQSLLAVLPTGIHSPAVIRYNAASVPILQLGLSSDTLSEGQIYDIAYNFLRTQLANTQGASLPLPYGGKPRQIMVDINPQALYAHKLSAGDVSSALNSQSLILPTGSAKIGTREYRVEMNNSPSIPEQFNNLPVKTVDGVTIYLRDVAQVRDGAAVQSNIVRHDGRRGVLLTVLKNGKVSTIDIVNRIKAQLPRILSSLPPEFKVRTLFDQSVFVKSSDSGCGEGSRGGGHADRVDDPAVSGKLAQHADRVHLDSAFDSDFARGVVRDGRNHQHHDAGRARAGGRNPGRRRDGRDRKHPSQPGDGQGRRSRRFWMARGRSRCPRSYRRCASALFSCP